MKKKKSPAKRSKVKAEKKLRNEYDATEMFMALEVALTRRGHRVDRLTVALSRRWKRRTHTIYRYQSGSKRLPVALMRDLLFILRKLGEKRRFEDLIITTERIRSAPAMFLKSLKQERTHARDKRKTAGARRRGRAKHRSA